MRFRMGQALRVSVRPLSLGHRVVARVALGLALVLGALGFIALWTLRETSEAAYDERVTLAQVVSSRVSDTLQNALKTLEREAADLTFDTRQPVSEIQLERLKDPVHRFGGLVAMAITDTEGTVIWIDADPSGDIDVAQRLSAATGRLARNNAESQITQALPQVATAPTFAILAVPLYNASQRFSGALVAEFDPGHPSLSLVPRSEFGDSISVQLLNSDGQFLAGTSAYNARAVAAHRVLLADLIQGARAGHRIHEPGPGASFPAHLVAYAPVSRLPSWGVTLEQPQDIVLELPDRLQGRLAWFGFLALLLAAVVAWNDVRRVVRPLNALTAAAERFAAGHFEQPVRLERADELGILARAFETMRQRLRASLAEVAEWNRSALLEPERVIALVVRKARDVIGAEVAGLSLVNEGSGDISWHLLADSGDQVRLIHQGPGESMAGYVVRTGRPIIIPDWGSPPVDGPDTAPILVAEGLRSALAVPLQSGGRTLGVLMAANRTPTTFGEDQVALLSSLADQAAVALDNARLYQKVQDLAVLEERERIAREMHDGLGQVLGYVNTKTLAVARLLEMGKIEEAREQVAQLEAAAKEVYGDVREAILGLRTTLSPDLGLLAALRQHLEGFEQQGGIHVELVAPDAEGDLRLPFATEIQLLRVVQEALANVRKHARASLALVRLERADGSVRLIVEDDGVGFDPERLPHEGWPRFGLQTMKERAGAIGGTFVIDSSPGTGTRVILTVPHLIGKEVPDTSYARATR